MNKYMISLVMIAATILGVSTTFGMNPGYETIPTYKLANKNSKFVNQTPRIQVTDKNEGPTSFVRNQRNHMNVTQDRRLQEMKQELAEARLAEKEMREQLEQKNKERKATEKKLDKKENKLSKKKEALEEREVSKHFSVVRGVAVGLAATWRISHYANMICQALGKPAWSASDWKFNVGCLVAGGTIALLDYIAPGKVGCALATAFGMDFLHSRYLSQGNTCRQTALISPRLG